MNFVYLALMAIAAVVPAEACKCLDVGGTNNVANTQNCCNNLGGSFVNGNDCNADSISEQLSDFRACCESAGSVTSDCDFPSPDWRIGALLDSM
ncbi:hypothetical protein AURDEDRAFT_168970 [Auricularia subglabra TFB-10046 SS5]|nr:hypothetical protein AURDEDRAFT_168970 [Auricularia subglabra TFB-10046 SS5]